MSICNEPNASQHHNAKINHFRIRAFTRKQVVAWFRRSLSDKTGQTLTLHRTNKHCGTAPAQVHRGLEIKSSCDDIITILIVRYVCYSTIAGGSSQHSAVAQFNLYVAATDRSHFDAV